MKIASFVSGQVVAEAKLLLILKTFPIDSILKICKIFPGVVFGQRRF